jgi:hypothetical protein
MAATTPTKKAATPPTSAEVRARLIQPLDESPTVHAAIMAAGPILTRAQDLETRHHAYLTLTDPHRFQHLEVSPAREQVLQAAASAPTAKERAEAEQAALAAMAAIERARQVERDEREALFVSFMGGKLPSAFTAAQQAINQLSEISEIEYLRHESGTAGGYFNPVSLPQLAGWLEASRDEARRCGYVDSDS